MSIPSHSKVEAPSRKILICGPCPAPLGGVSVHISRLERRLSEMGFDVSLCDEAPVKKDGIYNIRSLNFFSYFKLVQNSDLVHIHSSVHLLRLFHLFVCLIFRKRTLVTIHSWRAQEATTIIWRAIFWLFNPNLIFVNEEIESALKLPGSVIHAYVRPDPVYEPELPADLIKWVKNQRKNSNTKIFVSNASRLETFAGEDLYGLDLCIDAIGALKRDGQNPCMIFAVSQSSPEEEMMLLAKERIKQLRLDNNFLIWRREVSYVKLLDIADGSIRATNTDGDALSVRESIGLGCPAVASDCVLRPKGTILFENRNVESLAKQLDLIMLEERERQVVMLDDDCCQSILDEYDQLSKP